MTFTVSTKAASPTSLEEPFWCSFFISGTMENSLPQKSRFNILPSINPILLTQYNNQIEHTGDSESQILWHFQNAVVRETGVPPDLHCGTSTLCLKWRFQHVFAHCLLWKHKIMPKNIAIYYFFELLGFSVFLIPTSECLFLLERRNYREAIN